MDAPTPDDPDRQKQSLDQDSPRLPSPDDPDIDEDSPVSQIIAFGKHANQMGGKSERAAWAWRRRRYKALHCLRARGLRGKAFADAAANIGMKSRSESFKLDHFWGEIDAIDSYVAHKCKESVQLHGVEQYPSDNELLREFPGPATKSGSSKAEKEEDKAEEAEARQRARANANATIKETLDPDALAAQIAKLTREVAIERAEREDMARKLAREQEVSKVLHEQLEQAEQHTTTPKPVSSPEVPAQVSDLYDDALCDLYDAEVLAIPDPVAPTMTPDPVPDPSRIALSPDVVVGDARDDMERLYHLAANWAGPKPKNEAAARRIMALRNARAHFYAICGERLTEDERKAALKIGKDRTTWEPGTPIAHVLTKIAAQMAKPATAETPTTAEGQ